MNGRLRYGKPDAAGVRRVVIDNNGTRCIGRLMPENPDSRQQPKCAAHRMLEQRMADKRWASITEALVPRRTHYRTIEFTNHPFGGHNAYDAYTGQALGHVLPSVSPEVLAASPGIQSWSRPQ